mmetsp:Transcript_587/g.1315  ORF Transcript_587/g.1315 Transcript_587/m.1315 type:complete len:214 (-) Transcript_587:926-1567(-)
MVIDLGPVEDLPVEVLLLELHHIGHAVHRGQALPGYSLDGHHVLVRLLALIRLYHHLAVDGQAGRIKVLLHECRGQVHYLVGADEDLALVTAVLRCAVRRAGQVGCSSCGGGGSNGGSRGGPRWAAWSSSPGRRVMPGVSVVVPMVVVGLVGLLGRRSSVLFFLLRHLRISLLSLLALLVLLRHDVLIVVVLLLIQALLLSCQLASSHQSLQA